MTNINRGYIDIIIFSFFVGLVGICVKSIKNLDALTITFYRGAIAAIFILLLSILLGKGSTLVRCRFGKGVTLNVAGLTLGIGLLQTLMLVLYIYSLLLTTVSNAVFLHSTAPIFALIFSRIFLKEAITRKTYVGIVLVMAGTCVIVDPRNLSLHSAESIGNIVALASGLFYGAMAVTSKSLSPKVDSFYQVFWQYMIVALLILPFANLRMNTFPTHSFAIVGDPVILMMEPTWKDTLFVHNLTLNWVPLSVLGIFGSGVCYIFFVRGVKTVPANHIMLAAGLEPVFGALVATLYLGEAFSTLTTVGAGLILAGIYQISMRDVDERTACFGKSVAERTQKIKGASSAVTSDNVVRPVRQYPIPEYIPARAHSVWSVAELDGLGERIRVNDAKKSIKRMRRLYSGWALPHDQRDWFRQRSSGQGIRYLAIGTTLFMVIAAVTLLVTNSYPEITSDATQYLRTSIGLTEFALIGIFFVVGIYNTAVGSTGGVTFATLSTLLTPAVALPIHATLEITGGVVRGIIMREYVDIPFVFRFAIGSGVGAVAAWPFMGLFEFGATMYLLIGGYILISAWYPISNLAPKRAAFAVGSGVVIGSLAPFVGGIGSLLMALIRQRHDDHRMLLGTYNGVLIVHHGYKVLLFGLVGFSFAVYGGLLILLTIASSIGTLVGKRILVRVPPERFKPIIKVLLTLLALKMLYTGMSGWF